MLTCQQSKPLALILKQEQGLTGNGYPLSLPRSLLSLTTVRSSEMPRVARPDTDLHTDYPDLEGDEARRGIWLVDVPLAATHKLRAEVNTGKPIPHEVLEQYEIPIVASVLKLYLLELPGKPISSPCELASS